MGTQKTSGALRRASQMAWFAALLLFSVISTRIVSWRVPGLDLQARNWLIRTRGPLPVPNDIAIVAIDETSLAHFGRYPWRRSLMAQLVSRLAEAHPKAIALDVLFSETTSADDDTALTTAIAKAGNVITAAQLIRTDDGRIHWLRPLPSIERAAAAVGHVQVSTDVDGVAGSFLVREADDEGQAEWAMALETICVGDGASHCPANEVPAAVVIGARTIPVRTETRTMEIESGHPQSMQLLNASWIPIEYAGPPGTFSSYTFSFGDVLDGRVNASAIREKYVIVGATAAALGDRFSSPFVRLEGPAGQQNGEFVPGTEVLANSLNTVLRQRFYSETPEWLAIGCAALVALIALAGLSLAQGKHETLKQAGMIVLLAGLIVGLNYIAFARWLVFPPLVSCSVSLIGAVPLILFHRSLVASRELDNQIQKMVSAESRLWPSAGAAKADPADLVAHLTGAVGAAILSRMPSGRYRLAASSGIPLLPSLKKMDELLLMISAGSDYQSIGSSAAAVPEEQVGRLFYEKQDPRAQRVAALRCFLGNGTTPRGVLVLLHHVERNVPPERLRIGVELANGFLTAIEAGAAVKAEERESRQWEFWRRLPRGITSKTRELGALNYRLLSNSRFVDQSLRSVGDGLLVGGTAGQIVFFNRRAAEILGMGERSLLGSDLLSRLGITESIAIKTMERLYVDRVAVEREVSFGESSPRHYILRLSPVLEGEKELCAVVGVVASLSDITKQRELQQMKTEVMALVTHELRTPITAIQGMSEVLAQFDVETERRREMNAAINEEAKRLGQMIDEYLDITYLEASARQLRKTPLRVDTLVERVLLLLNPWAASRGIRITSVLDQELPVVLADSELLARAVTNLVANAVKYSQSGREVRVSVRASGHELLIAVADRGCGISAEDLQHIFEKFYRVQRAENAGEPGTGLGLALVHEIMTSHGGRVDVESELGAGSTFTLRLPLFSKENQAPKQPPDS
jgi:two-component system, OmpR family, phosphate regulon sensor histidine kinase PhoR